jgi:hypothetical protein
VNLGIWKESKEEARGLRGRAGMVMEGPAVSLVVEVPWAIWLSLDVKSRALIGVV